MQREQIDFDVVFVGAGPACLAGAIRLMQLAGERNPGLQVAIIEKGADIGVHAVSGAILNPAALAELIPDFQEKGCPVETMVHEDDFYFLAKHGAYPLPLTPRDMRNRGCLVISQSRFVRWLAGVAQDMGVNMLPGSHDRSLRAADSLQTPSFRSPAHPRRKGSGTRGADRIHRRLLHQAPAGRGRSAVCRRGGRHA